MRTGKLQSGLESMQRNTELQGEELAARSTGSAGRSATEATKISGTIYLVDDDDSFRTAVERLLRATGYRVRTYSSGAEFARAYPSSARTGVACVLLDLHMPGPSGLDLQEELARTRELLPTVFISGHGDIPASVRAMKTGAVDFLTKPIAKVTLLRAIANALALDAEGQAQREGMQQKRLLFDSLTPQERSVFDGVVSGKLNKQIAADLGAAERTIKVYRRQVMKKMKADSVAGLVRLALELQAGTDRGPATDSE